MDPSPPHKGKGHGFTEAYTFNECEAVVVIRSEMNGKSLRVKPGQLGISEVHGGFGGFARWKIKKTGHNLCKLQSCKSMKFIRVSPKTNGESVDVLGGGGKFTEFRVHRMGQFVCFESVVYANKYLAVDAHGNVYASNGYVEDKGTMFKVLSRPSLNKSTEDNSDKALII